MYHSRNHLILFVKPNFRTAFGLSKVLSKLPRISFYENRGCLSSSSGISLHSVPEPRGPELEGCLWIVIVWSMLPHIGIDGKCGFAFI